MAPGRKMGSTKRKPSAIPEEPPTEYEKLRAQNMMRNNQVLQSLGVSTLAAIVNNAAAKRKGDGPQESGSLYDPDIECSEVEEISKAAKDASNISARGPRSSKRVMALEQQDEPRVTRQRTAASQLVPTLSQNMDTHDELVSATSPSQHEDQIHIAHEGAVTLGTQEIQRGISMGKELERISRGLNTKLAIQISEGKRRPEAPMQAAKLASESGIIVRQHLPILPHWKEYKKKKSESDIANYLGKLSGQFTIDINNKAVNDACMDMLKGAQRQMRYRLKKKYFNGVPANEVRTTSPVKCMTDDQWKELVEMWSTPKHKEKCIKLQENREKVQFQQRTGSRCYIAHAYVVRQENNGTEPTAVDLFKDTHCSKKVGFSEPVKKVIADMEAILAEPVEDGQQPKSCTDVVSQVLPQSSTFLQNVGLQSVSRKSSRGVVSSQVQELQAQLETEKQEAAEVRQELHTIKSHAKESEATIAKQSLEIESLKNTTQELSSLLRQLISFNHGQVNPTP